ncbi:MAG: BatA domain-containing protein [Planctomycetaceae bacterium]|nr:BatA domain-containing protein [Planctomycetaceae bacterium]
MLPPLFAFGWIGLPMLGWLAAAAAPILIHLWSRRRYRETSWAAMEYLLAAMRQRSRRIRFEQWLLLLVRTLLIMLVVLGVAEPYLESAGLAFAPGGRVHRVLVFDGSYSMACKPGDKSRFDRAKELARRLVDEGSDGDAFTLVLMSALPRTIVGSGGVKPATILQEIDSMQCPHAGGNLPATVSAVRRLVAEVGRDNPRLTRHEVYFLTDLHRATWGQKLLEPVRAEFLQQTRELAKAASLVVVDVGQPVTENLAITSVEATESPVTVGRAASFTVRLQNFGPRSLDRQPVEFFVDGRRIERKDVQVLAGGSASVGFSYRFETPGDHAVEARAVGDVLEVDNRRFLAVPVRQTVQTLCIDGRPSGGSLRGAADYLAVALQAGQKGSRAEIKVDVAPESALMERALASYDCVFLCNVAQLTASEARVIDRYLQGGGSVIVLLGDRVLADNYNRELGLAAGQAADQPPRDGAKVEAEQGRAGGLHLLPARIGTLVDRPQHRLDPLGYRHPIVQAFRGRGQTSLLTTPVFKHYRLEVRAGAAAAVVLALADGEPLVVEQPVHRGRVVLIGTSAEPAWTALPLWPSFVPLVHEIVAYCMSGELRRQNLTVGEPLDALPTLPTVAGSLVVQSPDGRRQAAPARTVGECPAVSFSDTSQSGIYVVENGTRPERKSLFAVNVDTAESDLTQTDVQELRSRLWPGVPFTYRTSSRGASLDAACAVLREDARFHIGLLYAALVLLLGETWLGWKMGYCR